MAAHQAPPSLGFSRQEHWSVKCIFVCIYIYVCCWTSRAHKHVYSLSCAPVVATPWTIAHQSPLFMGFPRQEYWSGLPFASPGDLPNPGIKPRSPALQEDSLSSKSPGKPKNTGMGSLSLLQGIFLTQRLNPGLPHCRQILYCLSHQGSPELVVMDREAWRAAIHGVSKSRTRLKRLSSSSSSSMKTVLGNLRVMCLHHHLCLPAMASLVAQAVKNLPAMQETWV